MTTTQIQTGQISGAVLMYTRPEPLSLDLHAKLGINRSDRPFDFAETTTAVPLHVTEFGPASLTFPIIFAGEELMPLAIMGLRQNENLFVEGGVFDANVYVPAFIRRYPFVLANNEADQQMIVCIDRGASSVTEGGDVALFENGEPSAFTQAAIKFCGDFEAERLRSEQFVKTLKELDLFEPKQASFTPTLPDGSAGQPIQLADYFAISEEKLGKLAADKVAQLHASGALRQVYAHLNSAFNWERLVAKSGQRPPQAANA